MYPRVGAGPVLGLRRIFPQRSWTVSLRSYCPSHEIVVEKTYRHDESECPRVADAPGSCPGSASRMRRTATTRSSIPRTIKRGQPQPYFRRQRGPRLSGFRRHERTDGEPYQSRIAARTEDGFVSETEYAGRSECEWHLRS